MAIAHLNQADVLRRSRQALRLSFQADPIDEIFLAACLRRAAAIFAPCSRVTLIAAVADSLEYLSTNPGELREKVENAVEGLVVIGDLLELDQVALNTAEAKSNWLFAAPPGFVARPDGGAFLTGIAPDALSPLPASFQQRILYQGYVRILRPEPGEDIPALLAELGLLKRSERAWLKLPKETTAEQLHRDMLHRLDALPPSGHAEGLLVLDPTARVDYYRGRWKRPGEMSGTFVARRPQAYGAPLWGFALLDHGALARLLDFPVKGFRWRGCDAAWHLQAAIDHCRARRNDTGDDTQPEGRILTSFRRYPCGLNVISPLSATRQSDSIPSSLISSQRTI